MKVMDYKVFGSIGFLVAAAGLAVGSSFIAPDLALADKPSLKRNFRLSDGLKDLQQTAPSKIESDADRQQSQWQRIEKSRLRPDNNPTAMPGFPSIIPRIPYENPNGFRTIQFERSSVPTNNSQS
jgi:hypothetical protein